MLDLFLDIYLKLHFHRSLAIYRTGFHLILTTKILMYMIEVHFQNVRLLLYCPCLILQGQMLYIPETDVVVFQCYPSVTNLDDLTR